MFSHCLAVFLPLTDLTQFCVSFPLSSMRLDTQPIIPRLNRMGGKVLPKSGLHCASFLSWFQCHDHPGPVKLCNVNIPLTQWSFVCFFSWQRKCKKDKRGWKNKQQSKLFPFLDDSSYVHINKPVGLMKGAQPAGNLLQEKITF